MTALLITGCILGWLMCGLLPAKAAYRVANQKTQNWRIQQGSRLQALDLDEPIAPGFTAFFPFILGPLALIFWLAWLFWRAPTLGERRLERARKAEAELAEARRALREAGIPEEIIKPETKQPERHSWKLKVRTYEHGVQYFLTDGVNEKRIGSVPFDATPEQHATLSNIAFRRQEIMSIAGE